MPAVSLGRSHEPVQIQTLAPYIDGSFTNVDIGRETSLSISDTFHAVSEANSGYFNKGFRFL